MAYIGTNNLILQFEQKLEDDINKSLTDGIPPIVVQMVLGNYKRLIDDLVAQTLDKENDRYRAALAKEQQKDDEECMTSDAN